MEMPGANEPSIDVPSLPDISLAEMDFRDTSFFQTSGKPLPNRSLPTPDEIRQQFPSIRRGGRDVIKFEHLNLVVKAGDATYLRLEEAQVLWALRKAFPAQEVPVPELFGWRKSGHQNFIYMSLIQGPTLYEAWPSFTAADKALVQRQVANIVSSLRQLSQGTTPASERYIGSINGGAMQDRFFRVHFEEGPFWSVRTFNDFLGAAALRLPLDPGVLKKNPYRMSFTDSNTIFFTHGDLTPSNIILSKHSGTWRVAGIIDWEQAGWYPEYWEYCKLLLAVDYEHEWRSEGWANGVMRPFEAEFEAFMIRRHPDSQHRQLSIRTITESPHPCLKWRQPRDHVTLSLNATDYE